MRTPIYIILTTYKRQQMAIKTIDSFVENARYENGQFRWIVCDDGSPEGYLDPLRERVGHMLVHEVNSNRHGVGYGMNQAIRWIREHEGLLLITLEDDWELITRLEFAPYADMLMQQDDLGMIRFGYLSPGLSATVDSRAGRLWWFTQNNGYQYRYAGHPALKHMRFYNTYGLYTEGLAPGATELDMCGKVNGQHGPAIIIPIQPEQAWGSFVHIGAESLADVPPEKK